MLRSWPQPEEASSRLASFEGKGSGRRPDDQNLYVSPAGQWRWSPEVSVPRWWRPPVPFANGALQVGGGSPTLRCLRCGHARETTSVQPVVNDLEAGLSSFSRPLACFRGREDAPVVALDAIQQLDNASFLGLPA